MYWISLLGSILACLYFTYSGVNVFLKRQEMIDFACEKGMIFPQFCVSIGGILLLVGGLLLLSSEFIALGCIIIIMFLSN